MYTFTILDFINERNSQKMLNLNDMEADGAIKSILNEYIKQISFPCSVVIVNDMPSNGDLLDNDSVVHKSLVHMVEITGVEKKNLTVRFYIPVIRELFKKVYNGMMFELRDMIRYLVRYNYRRVCQITYFFKNDLDLTKYDDNKTIFDVDAAYFSMDRDRDIGELVSSVIWR